MITDSYPHHPPQRPVSLLCFNFLFHKVIYLYFSLQLGGSSITRSRQMHMCRYNDKVC
jgi:hypothetical protein